MVALAVLFSLTVVCLGTTDGLLLEPRRRCAPTAVARAPCHVCVCSVDGEYHCRVRACDHTKSSDDEEGKKECEPGYTYRDDELFCTCSEDGFWKSTNCRTKFHQMTTKINHLYQKLRTNIACTPNSLYLLDCNICKCGEKGVIELSSCTHRRCKKGNKVDLCTYGDILRTTNEVCACSDIDLYIDRLCFKVTEDSVQEIKKKDVESIIEIGRTWTRTNDIHGTACVPRTVIRIDCNRCICTDTGVLACTRKHCVMPHSASLRSMPANKFSSLPELRDLESQCTPNTQYRYKCNTCVCSLKGIPSCTTMICLEDYVLDKKAMEATMLE